MKALDHAVSIVNRVIHAATSSPRASPLKRRIVLNSNEINSSLDEMSAIAGSMAPSQQPPGAQKRLLRVRTKSSMHVPVQVPPILTCIGQGEHIQCIQRLPLVGSSQQTVLTNH
jgi:hypothetical protein